MADFFKPRRGTQLRAKEVLNGENALRAGELFFELEYVEGKTVKSGRIMIGDGHSSYEQLVRNNRYVFNPDNYMGVTSKFEPTPSTETTITDNRNIINSANTNIKEKMGAIDATIDLLDENKSEKTHNHTTADITNFVTNVKTIKVNTASRADHADTATKATNASTADYAKDADRADRDGRGLYFIDSYISEFDYGAFTTLSTHAVQYGDIYDQFTLYADSYAQFSPRAAFPYISMDDKKYVCILDMKVYIEGKATWGNNAIYKLKDIVKLKAPGMGPKNPVTTFSATMEKEYDIISTGSSALNTIYIHFGISNGSWCINQITSSGSGGIIAGLKVNIHNVKYIYYTGSTDNE